MIWCHDPAGPCGVISWPCSLLIPTCLWVLEISVESEGVELWRGLSLGNVGSRQLISLSIFDLSWHKGIGCPTCSSSLLLYSSSSSSAFSKPVSFPLPSLPSSFHLSFILFATPTFFLTPPFLFQDLLKQLWLAWSLLCSPVWLWTPDLPPLPPECWGHRHSPPCLVLWLLSERQPYCWMDVISDLWYNISEHKK